MGRCAHVHRSLVVWYLLSIQRTTDVGAQSDNLSVVFTPSPTATFLDYPDCAGYLPRASDGYCDSANNNAECGFDGGDCCACTCVDGRSHSCGKPQGEGYNCQDPDVPDDCGSTPKPVAIFGYPNCTGLIDNFQNGYCNDDLNVEECDYDGGDCCRCTCRNNDPYPYDDIDWRGSCGSNGYICRDPRATNNCATETEGATPNPTGLSLGYYYFYGGRGRPASIAGATTMGPSASDQNNNENDPELFSKDNVDSARLFSGVQLAAVVILSLWGYLCFGTFIAGGLWWVRHRYLGDEPAGRVLIRQRLPRTAIIPEPASLTYAAEESAAEGDKRADGRHLEEGKATYAARATTRRDPTCAAPRYGENTHVKADADNSKYAEADDFDAETRGARGVDSWADDAKTGRYL